MQQKNFLKKISYNPLVVKLVSFLHLRTILRKMYFYISRPKNNILDVLVLDLMAKFYVKNPDDLRLVESVTGDAGEKKVIESFLSLINKGDIVYDVGANQGTYSVLMAKKVASAGKIIAFEPEQESYKLLMENIALNELKNIEVIKKALGKENVNTKLYIGKTTGNFSLVKSYEENLDAQDIEVVYGDEFVLKNNLPIPKAVKIDVEGYEYNVLVGLKNTLSSSLCRVICCEIHPGLFPDKIEEKDILTFIKSLGFSNVEVFKRGFSAYHIIAHK